MNQIPSTQWSPTRRQFLSVSAMATGGLVLSACGTAATKQNSGGGATGAAKEPLRKGTAAETFFVAGFQWGPPTNFNPIGPSPAWPAGGGQSQILFETLVRWNMLDGKTYDGLAKGEFEKPDAQTFVVTLNDGTKWNDGQDLTADDVVFTFELAKDNSLAYSNVWTYLESVTAKDPKTVEFKLKAKPLNPGVVTEALCSTYIIPKHIWEKVDGKKLATETNMNPVGSGPFKVEKADQTQIIMARRDDYWGKDVFGTPKMKTIAHPIFKGNQDGDLKLESGELDASQQFTAQIWKMWEKGKPVGTWLKDKPYYLPGSMPSLIINIHKKGLSNPGVRKAIAYAIDYPNIASKAMSSYSADINASMILPEGAESAYYDQAAVDATGWKFDKDKAIEILEKELKCKKGSDGIYSLPDGTRLGPWKLITPTGWTDWNTSCEIIAKSLQAVGIDVSTNFPQAATMISAMQNGNFDLCHYSYTAVNAATPWARFRDLLDDRGVPDIGKTAFQNYSRFKDAAVPALLDEAAAATDDAAKKTALQKLDEIYRKNIPIIPVMYRPKEFYEFNQGTWTNFPTKENAYAPPTWSGQGIKWIFDVKPVGS